MMQIVQSDGLAGRMRELQGVLETPNARRLGHEIKGLASMYGLDAVADAALAIERGATDQTLPDLVLALDRCLADATRQLGAFARDLASHQSEAGGPEAASGA